MDQMRDFFSPTQVLCNRIPREHFEAQYSIMLPKPADHEEPNRPPTAHELLTTVAFLKGFMSTKGVPDCSRAARLMLKDVVSGKLKWSAAPPGGPSQKEFDEMTFSLMKHVQEGNKPANSTLLDQVTVTINAHSNLAVSVEQTKPSGRRAFQWLEGRQHVLRWRGGRCAR